MLLRPLKNGNCFPFSHIFCKGLPYYSLLALSPVLPTLVFAGVTPTHTSPSKAEPAMMTPVTHCITQKSFLLPLKTPGLQSHRISQRRTSAPGSQPIPFSEHSSLISPFMFFSHKCHWLGCFSSQYPNPTCPSFQVYLTSASTGIVTSKPLQS